MKVNIIRIAIISSLIALINSVSYAQEISLEKFLGIDDQVFSLSKKQENAFDSPAATYVISSQDIKRSGVTSIPEALRMAPGLHVARQGSGKWAIASRGFNHQYSNKLLILVDGRIVYSPVFSGAFWDIEDYILEDIDRIEVIRGPGGTIWGANAVNGIINIITKSATSTTGGYASITSGNLDKYIMETRYGGKINEDLFYRLYAKSSKRNDFDTLDHNNSQDSWEHSRTGFRADYYKSSKDNITIHGDLHRGKAQNYFSIFPNPNGTNPIFNPDKKESQGSNLVAKWNRTISNSSSTNLQAYIDYRKFDINAIERSAYTYDLDFQHIWNPTTNNQLIWGLGFKLITDEMKDGTHLKYSPSKRKDDILSAFLQDKISLLDDSLHFIIGSKFEHNDYTNFEYQPSAKIAIYPTENQTIWTAVSRAVRTPTRGEDGFILPLDDTSSASGYTSLKGSDDYDAERLIAYELGYRIRPNKKTMLDLAAFYNDYSNLQTFEYDSNGTGDSAAFLVADNLGEAESFGFELNAKLDATRYWKLEASYSYINLDINTDRNSTDQHNTSLEVLHKEERTVPNNQFRITSLYNITPKLELNNTLYYVDSIDGDGTSVIDEYYRLDAILTYRPITDLSISLVGQNLTEDTHQEYGKSLYSNAVEVPRSYHAKISYRF